MKQKEILSSGIVILQFPNGIDFDGEKAYLLIGIAGVGDEHLEILSNIAVVLDDDLTERLKIQMTNKLLWKLLPTNLRRDLK